MDLGPQCEATSTSPAPRHPALRILAACGLGLSVLVLSGSVAGLLLHGRMELRRQHPWLDGAANHLPILFFSVVLMLLVSRGRLRDYGFRRPGSFRPGWALLIPVAASALASGLEKSLHLGGMKFLQNYSLGQSVVLIWVLASVAEETLTRGLIQGFLEPLRGRGLVWGRLRLSAPVLTSGLFFGAMHLMVRTMGVRWPMVWTIVGFAVVIGCTAGVFRERTGSLLPAILVHATANITGSLIDLLSGK